jgi:hypothetical protein
MMGILKTAVFGGTVITDNEGTYSEHSAGFV